MALKKVTYSIEGKKNTLLAKPTSILSTGLMFKKTSPPLIFKIPRSIRANITSMFCKPFKAIWLDEKMNATQVSIIKRWKWKINGHGRYLIEIPLTTKKGQIPTESRRGNRNI